jgi:16S rRNA G527 N7-methylase RsmG
MSINNKENKFKYIFDIAAAPIKEKLLMAAITLNIFDLLVEPKSASEIADKIKSHKLNTELFLNALTSLELIHKENGLYSNSYASKEILVNGQDGYLGEYLISNRGWSNIGLNELVSLVKNGAEKKMEIGGEDIWEKHARLSANHQKLEAIHDAQDIISSLPEYPNMKKMLDLGAGAGLIGINLINNHPSMTGVIFDQPTVAKVAKEFVSQYKLDDRIEVRGGNYTKDDIGSGYDLVWARLTFNFHQQELNSIAQKIYNALNEGGVFIYFGDGLKQENTYPTESIMHMLLASIQSGFPLNISQGKVEDAMINSGFKTITNNTIMTNQGEMDLIIGRK